MNALTIGFDLDMTLIDSRPGIKAVYDELARQTGIAIDSALAVSRLGPPLELELANWFPANRVEEMADRYRALYPALAIPRIEALPGAAKALAAVCETGRAIVITAKKTSLAKLHLDHLGLKADAVHGLAWHLAKAQVLRSETAQAYVGDHIHDMEAAVAAEAFGVGVSTGPCSADDLRAHGAGEVLGSLEALSELLENTAF